MRPTDGAERVLSVLELLADARRDLGVTEIARSLGVHKATASRLLATLARRSIVERDPVTGRYRMGVGLIRLAGVALNDLDVVRQAQPELESLCGLARETVNLGVLDGSHVVYVDQVTAPHAIVTANWVGRRSPAHCSSSGKVMLAFGDPVRAEEVLRRPLRRLARSTVTDPAKLREVLDETRRRGYARTVGELEDGLNTVAAPVWADDTVVAAVSISGPSFRLPAREQPRLGKLAADAGMAISRRLGRRGATGFLAT